MAHPAAGEVDCILGRTVRCHTAIRAQLMFGLPWKLMEPVNAKTHGGFVNF